MHIISKSDRVAGFYHMVLIVPVPGHCLHVTSVNERGTSNVRNRRESVAVLVHFK